MSHSFQVGELAIAVKPSGSFEFNETIVTVTAPLQERSPSNRFESCLRYRGLHYEIRLNSGQEVWVEPKQVRKLSKSQAIEVRVMLSLLEVSL